MGTHDGHRGRMKKEFLQGGLTAFSDVRALELLLFYSRMQGDVNPTAHALLDTFGSLAGVLDADPEQLLTVPGVGENTAVLLKLVPALAAKYLASRTSPDTILVGFKLLSGVPHEELIDVGYRLLQKNDYTIDDLFHATPLNPMRPDVSGEPGKALWNQQNLWRFCSVPLQPQARPQCHVCPDCSRPCP